MSAQNATETNRSLLNLHDIYDFANTVDIAEVGGLMEDQVRCNMAIAREGLSNAVIRSQVGLTCKDVHHGFCGICLKFLVFELKFHLLFSLKSP